MRQISFSDHLLKNEDFTVVVALNRGALIQCTQLQEYGLGLEEEEK